MPSTSTDRISGLSTSVAIKAPCRYTTSANITLSGLAVQSGGEWVASLDADDRIFVQNQSNQIDNGIWLAGAGTWRRDRDFDGARDAVQGTMIPVYRGTGTYSIYAISTENPIVIGTTELEFEIVDDGMLAGNLANTSDSALGAAMIGYQGRTLSAELKAFLQTATGFFFTGNGAHINRFNDRVFIGGATVNDGAFPNVTNDWLGTLSATWASGQRNAGSAVLAAFTDPTNGSSAQAIIGAAQSKLFGAANAAAIGVFGVGVNNHTTLTEYAWGGYFEAHRENDTVLGAVGIEVDAYQGGAVAATNPYHYTESGVTDGYAIGLQMAAGAGRTTGNNCTAAAIITANGKAWDKGIVFFDGAIGGSAKAAVCLPKDYTMRWWGSGTEQTSTLVSSATTSALAHSLRFIDGATDIYASVDQTTQFRVNLLANAANFIAAQPVTATNPPQLRAQGTDTNIDILLSPKGTGVVRFGTYTAGVVAQAGYITINDSSGATRRLLVG